MIILSTKVTCSEIFMEKYQREGIEIEICQKSNLFYVTTNLNTLRGIKIYCFLLYTYSI